MNSLHAGMLELTDQTHSGQCCCAFFGGEGGADGLVQLAEAIVVTAAAAVAGVRSVNKTILNKTAFNNIMGHITHILG